MLGYVIQGHVKQVMRVISCLPFIITGALLSATVSFAATTETVEKNSKPTAQTFQVAQDQGYGRVLFEFHQGKYLDALTTLNVVNAQGSIVGHGDHPKLLEGGLLLSTGMVNSARELFEGLLASDAFSTLSDEDKNLAWFYMGKVLYLQQFYQAAVDSFSLIGGDAFKSSEPDLFQEMLYLLHRIEQLSSIKLDQYANEILPEGSIWGLYVSYNEAAKLDKREEQIVAFESLRDGISLALASSDSSRSPGKGSIRQEKLALLEQTYLTLSQLFLELNQPDQALAELSKIKKDSHLVEQAYFGFAVAASQAGQYEIALSALKKLQERKLFTPWLQQVPFATAYLYEQMGEAGIALEAYKAAVAHHEQLDESLKTKQTNLSEEVLVAALNLQGNLGSELITNDAYGRIDVSPASSDFAFLLSDDRFQSKLTDLHELYKIQQGMNQWHSRLDSFQDMMALRIAVRNQKINTTRAAMEAQQADQWTQHTLEWEAQINQAIDRHDLSYFLTEEQKSFERKIAGAYQTLADLPESHPFKEEFKQRLDRASAYFKWYMSEEYAVNKWSVVKQLRALKREMVDFTQHQAALQKEMSQDRIQEDFQARIETASEELNAIQEQLALSLTSAREALLDAVQQELARQREENLAYLRESRRSLARVADLIYQGKHMDVPSSTEVAQ